MAEMSPLNTSKACRIEQVVECNPKLMRRLCLVLLDLYTKLYRLGIWCSRGAHPRLGLFSMFSALELRPKDKTLCRNHMTKECLKGNDNGYGCPWIIYPGGLERNNYCGLCFECVKTCPYNNLALNLRSFGRDILAKTGRALDEAWKSFIMLTLAKIIRFINLKAQISSK